MFIRILSLLDKYKIHLTFVQLTMVLMNVFETIKSKRKVKNPFNLIKIKQGQNLCF